MSHEVGKLASFRDILQQHKEDYWVTHVEIQYRAASAWLAYAEGRHEEALEMMRAAATLEDSTDKHPVTPGQIVPAHDLLGMLLELNQPEEIQVEFNQVLQAEPGRFGALYVLRMRPSWLIRLTLRIGCIHSWSKSRLQANVRRQVRRGLI